MPVMQMRRRELIGEQAEARNIAGPTPARGREVQQRDLDDIARRGAIDIDRPHHRIDARKVEVIPGANGTLKYYGSAVSTTLRSVRGWVTSKKPESDYGCVVLPAGAFGGRNLGRFGFRALDSNALLAKTAVLSGYPGDKPFAEMWGMRRRIKIVTAKTLVYEIDTVGGQSGAPVYVRHNGQRCVVGIHNYGNSTGNSATRITPAVAERLKKWSVI